MFLKTTKTSLLTIKEFCKRRATLKGGKLTIEKKFFGATQKI